MYHPEIRAVDHLLQACSVRLLVSDMSGQNKRAKKNNQTD